MKPMPIALSAVLIAMTACGGGPASTDDCARAIDKANAVSRDEIKKMGLSDESAAKLKAITLEHCTNDKWDAKVVKCLSEAKTNEETLKCTDGLSAAQKLQWQNDMAAALPKETAGSASSSAPAGSGSSASIDLPSECQDYKAIMERLATCDKLGPAREAYQQAFAKVSAAWTQAGSTPEARAQLAQGCKTTVEAIRQSAAATCGW